MSGNAEIIEDIEQQLEEVLTNAQPDLQNVIKRGFTNVAIQRSKNGEDSKPEALDDTSYFSKNTQVNLFRLELVKPPSFHVQTLSLDLKTMGLSLRCSLGELNIKGLYNAFNENLYNLIPVMSEGHVMVSLSNMCADVKVGLILEDDALSLINPGIDFTHDEVLIKLSWPSPQRNGGYDFTTTEQLAKHIDDLPLSAAISHSLFALLRRRLISHLELVLKQATSVSELMCCNPSLMQAYCSRVTEQARNANKIIDVILINVRRTLLQSQREVLEVPPLHATFTHRIGSTSFMGKFETDSGWVKNLATINRINDVSVRTEPNKTSFFVTLRIRDLQIGFDEYRVKLMGSGPTGRLVAAVGENAAHLALTIGLAQWEPYAQLDDLRIDHMDGLDLHVTGLGALPAPARLARSWLRGALHAHVTSLLARQLQQEVHTAFRELPLWEMMHHA